VQLRLPQVENKAQELITISKRLRKCRNCDRTIVIVNLNDDNDSDEEIISMALHHLGIPKKRTRKKRLIKYLPQNVLLFSVELWPLHQLGWTLL
jgi:hypothetical protein